MKIGFTGTRRGMTTEQRLSLARLLRGWTGEFHHGDCVGSDAQAHNIAERLGFQIIVHPPENTSMRAFKSASIAMDPLPYLVRNRRIVDATERLIAAPMELSERLRSGIWSTVRYARKVGRPVAVIMSDGTVI